MISFDVYNVFYHVCKFKSITKAANYLCVSQPAITRHIKNLEKHLGVTLFHRTKKGLTLTEDAAELYEEVKKGIEIFNNIEIKYNSTKKEEAGTIRILAGYGTTKLILFPVIVEFNKLYPKVTFQIDHYPSKEAIAKLRNGEADLLLLNPKSNNYYNDLIYEPFYTLHNIFAVSSKIANEYPVAIKLKDINKYPIICKKTANSTKEFINNELTESNTIFNPSWELTDYWLVEQYIKMNMGIGIISREIIQESLDNQTFKEITSDIQLPEIKIHYSIRKNSILNPILIKFINYLKKYHQ